MNATKKVVPLRRVERMTDFGVFIKRIDSETMADPVHYPHSDNFVLFGFIEEGSCRVQIDFREFRLVAGDILCVRPGQVHRLIDEEQVKALVLFVDRAFVDPADRKSLTEFSLQERPYRLEEPLRGEIAHLFATIDRWTWYSNREVEDERIKRIVQQLASGAVGMIAESVRQRLFEQFGTSRYVDLAMAFRALLDREMLIFGGPSRYAAELHVSPSYLNEALRTVTGQSAGRLIHAEFMLRAKRMLLHSSMDVREIAARLGYDDAAYFTRQFTREVGVCPSVFRRQNLE